ncbi:CYTH and CHAD domain-containing protein [Actinomycetes bacterium KLBMP 9797]
MLEEERKYEVDVRFAVPDLSGCLPAGGSVVTQEPVTLTATYFDTPDLRLARAGVSLRFRRGDEEPWTVKLPADTPGTRHEISRGGAPGTPPADLVALVLAYSRGVELTPAAVVRTVRHAVELRDADGALLAELADDAVSVLDGRRVRARFREIEVERKGGGRKLLDRVDEVLRDAGAVGGGFVPKHVRALGDAAAAPPDLVPPTEPRRKPKAGEVVTAAIRRGTGRILAHDPLVRLRAPVGDNDTAVHQMRVGCRRLRSDLRTFGPLLDTDWAKPLRDEIGWFARVLGEARDAEVLRKRLHKTASADPLSPPHEASIARIDEALAARHENALATLDDTMRSDRYLKLVDSLVAAAAEPQLSTLAAQRADEVLPKLVSRPWQRLAHGAKGIDGAAELDPNAPDERWHAVRINGKKARYAVEAVAGVLGGTTQDLAKALAAVQDLLGEHQDAATAAETWQQVAAAHPDDHWLAVTAGRLFERERVAIRAARAAFPDAWRKASKPKVTAWLP